MNTETEYMNGGVTNGLIALAMEGGHKPTAAQLLTMAAHNAMPRGVFYTQSELDAKREEIKAKADAILPGWENDPNLDLYGVPTEAPRPKRMSKYDREHSTRK